MKNILSSYKNYRESGGPSTVKRKEFCKVVNAFNKYIMELVWEGHELKLPEKMGTLSVRGKNIETKYDEELERIDNQAVDYGETKKLWAKCPECKEKKQVIYHLNEHRKVKISLRTQKLAKGPSVWLPGKATDLPRW